MRPGVLTHEENVAGGEIKDRGKVGKIAGPVSPGCHKAGEIPEGALTPDVESAFAGITRGKFEHRKGERHIEAEPRSDPDDDGTRSSGGSSGDPTQADAGDDIKEKQIAKAEHAPRLVGVFETGIRFVG